MDAPRKKIITVLTPNSEVAESYLDVWGREKAIDPATRKALEQALGRARKPAKLRLEAGRCYEPELLAQGGRVWGFMVQLYGVRSKRNWGIGDFDDLRALIEFAAARGAAVVGVNPLHATQGSPYSPSSRLALNFLYLDVEAIPEYAQSAAAQRLVKTKAFQRKLEQLRKAPLVDYAGAAVLNLHVLELIFKAAKPRVGKPSSFAIFEALRENYGGGWERRAPRSIPPSPSSCAPTSPPAARCAWITSWRSRASTGSRAVPNQTAADMCTTRWTTCSRCWQPRAARASA